MIERKNEQKICERNGSQFQIFWWWNVGMGDSTPLYLQVPTVLQQLDDTDTHPSPKNKVRITKDENTFQRRCFILSGGN